MLVQLKKKFYLPLIAMMSVAFFFSCQKNIDHVTPDPTNPQGVTPDLTTRVNSSVSGFVTDENNAAVNGATVNVGTMSTMTDEYGYFEVKNVQVVKTAAVVTITKAGYFKGIKTYAATTDKAAFFRIKLIPKTPGGTISATAGGNVTLSNGLIIALPANGVVIAAGSAAYTGTVHVAVSWINPQAADLTQIMPGDLRGIDTDGYLKGLTTYGMAAVELTGDAGELLQVATGKKATITMPLSSLLSSAAPSSIPLWYFDETNGLWKQDGTATKTGNTYVGEVSHFSFWNCDLPNAIVPLTFTVVNGDGTPVADAYVEIRPTTPNSWSHCGGYTDATGYVSVFVTPDASYSLEIYSNCNSWGNAPDYSSAFSVTTTAVDLGNIVVGTAQTATVTGTITDCGNNPVTNGYIVVQNGWYYSRYPTDNTGSYNFTTVLCSGTTSVNLIAEDINGAQQSTPLAYTLVPGTNTIGNLQACGVANNEFIHYSVDGGLTYHDLVAPGDSLFQSGNGTSSVSYIVGSGNGSPTSNLYVDVAFDNTGIAAGSIQPLINFNSSSIADQPTVTTPIGVNITEYGAVGEYIAGNFTGTVTGSAPGNTPYPIVCTFRVRRNF
ncbi:MAG: carboxypeptidase-like regulatory domain-containing protein [Ferruginibacter sp.]